MSPSDFLDHPGSIYTIQNLQRSPNPQTSNWSGTFLCYEKGSLIKLQLELVSWLEEMAKNSSGQLLVSGVGDL